MPNFNHREICNHNISVNIRSGINIVDIKPLFSHDSQHVLIACGSSVKVFSVKSGECIQTLKHHSRPIVSIRENKKNFLQILSCSDEGVVVRWDYMDGEVLQVYSLNTPVTSFFAPTSSGPWFITKQFEDHFRLYSLVPMEKGTKQMQVVFKHVQPQENGLDFGYEGKFCASIFGNALTIYKFEEKSIKRHITGERNLTCVVCHPSDSVLATGDDQGRVVVWSNALNSNQPIRSIYHWHTLPVADLAFSSEGSHLFSGGGEAALVKWNLFSEERFILPRMGAPILRLTASRGNHYVLTAHEDNVLQVVDAQRNIVQVIQGVTRSQPQQNASILPAGLLYDAHLKALVMNGKPGHLQFYDIIQDRQLFNLDIAGKNFISQERDSTVSNIEIQKAALDDSGRWLATAEYWSDGLTSPQIWLKFWTYDLEKQTFVLNTNVFLPHNKELNAIVFSPQSPSPLAATTSSDGRFKIWNLYQSESDDKNSWSCEAMGYYRDLPAGSSCFSEDGSFLAVAFGSIATLWLVNGTVLKAVLCNEQNKKNIKQLLFGHNSCRHFLVCQDGASITVWDSSTFSIFYIINNEVQVLAVDPTSTTVAAFLKDQYVILFTPDNPRPIRNFREVSETPVVSALFVPKPSIEREEGYCFHHTSRLYFVNEAQNLLTFSEMDEEEEMATSKKRVQSNIVETPFGLLQAAQRVTDVKQIEPQPLSIPNQSEEQEALISNPTYQDPLALCRKILPSLLPARRHKDPKSSHKKKKKAKHLEANSVIEEELTWTLPIDLLNLNDCALKFTDFSFLQDSLAFSDCQNCI